MTTLEQAFEVIPARQADLGDGLYARRLLPSRMRRTIAAWCFLDHFAPTPAGGMKVGPHPHLGLQTLTWMFDGEVVHSDSLGNEQVVRPGQLNVLRAGRGAAHAEVTPPDRTGNFHGIQLWIAQPDWARHNAPAFEHHEELPRLVSGDAHAMVFMGDIEGAASPAYAETPLVGAEVLLSPRGVTRLPLRPEFEYGLAIIQGTAIVNGKEILPGSLLYLGGDRTSIIVKSFTGVRFMLLGGEPFTEPLFMWWNFVARDRDEIELAAKEWNAGSAFGEVAGSTLPRIQAPDFPWRSAAPSS